MQVLEKARQAKVLGSSLEAKVLLYVSDSTLRDSLQSWNQQPNNADPLRFMFIVSQVISNPLLDCLKHVGERLKLLPK